MKFRNFMSGSFGWISHGTAYFVEGVAQKIANVTPGHFNAQFLDEIVLRIIMYNFFTFDEYGHRKRRVLLIDILTT